MRTLSLFLAGLFLAGCAGSGTLPPNPEQGEIQYLTRENEQLQRRILELEEEHAAYRESLAEAEKEAAKIQTPDEVQQRISDLSAENEQLQQRIAVLEDEQAAYRESLAEAENTQQTDTAQLQQRIQDLEAERDGYRDRLATAENMAAQQTDTAELQQRIQDLEAERDDYMQRLAEAETAQTAGDPEIEQRVSNLQAERDGYRQSLDEAEQQIAALEEQLQTARATSPTAEPSASTAATAEVIFSMPADPHFISNGARLNRAGIAYMRQVAARLKSDYPGRRFRVIGYTDNTPLSERTKRTFPSNWELSAGRAGMLVRHLQWTHKMDPSRFEVVGLGHYHPLESNDTAEGRKANRTIRIVAL